MALTYWQDSSPSYSGGSSLLVYVAESYYFCNRITRSTVLYSKWWRSDPTDDLWASSLSLMFAFDRNDYKSSLCFEVSVINISIDENIRPTLWFLKQFLAYNSRRSKILSEKNESFNLCFDWWDSHGINAVHLRKNCVRKYQSMIEQRVSKIE